MVFIKNLKNTSVCINHDVKFCDHLVSRRFKLMQLNDYKIFVNSVELLESESNLSKALVFKVVHCIVKSLRDCPRPSIEGCQSNQGSLTKI